MARLRTEEISTIFEREEMAAGSVLSPRSGDVTFRTKPKMIPCPNTSDPNKESL